MSLPFPLRFSRMCRSHEREIMDADQLSEELLARAYRQLHALHSWLGNSRAVLGRLRKQQDDGRLPLRRVLDIGCGRAALLSEISKELGVEVIGFDLRDAPRQTSVPIFMGDAVHDPLPEADVAICVVMAHHLPSDDVRAMIQNVSRSCNRLILLDLVRHPVPLALFRTFVVPFLCRVNRLDGQTSIKRAFTGVEMRGLVEAALAEGTRPVRAWSHTVSAFWIRQIVDIEWEPAAASAE